MRIIQEINEIYGTNYKNAEQYLDKVMSALFEFEEFDDYYNSLEASGDQPMLQTFLAYYAN